MNKIRSIAAALALAALTAACASGGGAATEDAAAAGGECTPPETPVLTFAAYSTPREVYGKIIC